MSEQLYQYPEQDMNRSTDLELTRRQLTRLKWLTSLVPAFAIFAYETVRHDFLEHLLPVSYGNLLVGLLTFVLAFGFSEFVFRIIARLQARTLRQSREVAALSAVIEERERLSHELHDGVAQLVAYLSLRLGTVQELVAAERREEAIVELERLRGVADELSVDVHESIVGLRNRIAERGLLPTLTDYLDEFEERHRLSVALCTSGPVEHIPALSALQIFRITQEALANIRKHADAEHTWVTLQCQEPGVLELVVGDDGRGFDPARDPGHGRRSFGLSTMRERTESLGGSLRVESQPGNGTLVTVRLPFVEEEHGLLASAAR